MSKSSSGLDQQSLQQALANLPENAQEPIVDQIFMPEFLQAIGFSLLERVPQYSTGNGGDAVDYALRHNSPDNIFTHTKSNPYILVEIKGKDINLSPGSASYESTVKQLKRYLLSPNCTSVHWGIITNSNYIQVFRKHHKIVYPTTLCLEITPDNLIEIISKIRQLIEQPQRALTVAVYNNKGGVGKTTTTVNLAAVLSLQAKKCLIIDFDPNQQDLSHSLGLKNSKTSLYECLTDRDQKLANSIHVFDFKSPKTGKIYKIFDVIPADSVLATLAEDKLRQEIKIIRLHQLLHQVRKQYDYIFIDTPPNWRFFSQSAVYAADVVLIPAKHNNIFSLENAALAIKQYIPEVQSEKKDGSPVALPIFFNGEKMSDSQKALAQKAINNIIVKVQKEEKMNLTPYFFPRYTKANKDCSVFELPNYANIATAAFHRLPGACQYQKVREYYLDLAKEYFLQ